MRLPGSAWGSIRRIGGTGNVAQSVLPARFRSNNEQTGENPIGGRFHDQAIPDFSCAKGADGNYVASETTTLFGNNRWYLARAPFYPLP